MRKTRVFSEVSDAKARAVVDMTALVFWFLMDFAQLGHSLPEIE